jgi:hypothetical protein
VTFDSAGNLKLEYHGAHDRRRRTRQADQIIECDRCGAERRNQAGAFVRARLGERRRGRFRLFNGQLNRLTKDRAQHADHICCFGDEVCALLEQAARCWWEQRRPLDCSPQT